MYPIGHTIERYEVIEPLGSGGFGEVLRVRHTVLGTDHALKVLKVSDEAAHDRLLEEGRIQAQLDHPNLVRVRDTLETAEGLALVMDYVEGPTLADLLEQMQFEVAESERLFVEIVAGVHHAHEAGILHCDLKPSNILMDTTRVPVVPRVTDFGISRWIAKEATEEVEASMFYLGTTGYQAPECVGTRAIDQRADIFALGVVLYELLCGQRPFPVHSEKDCLEAIETGAWLNPRALRPDLPETLVGIVEGCLHPKAAERISSTQELLDRMGVAGQREAEPRVLRLRGAEETAGETLAMQAQDAKHSSADLMAAWVEWAAVLHGSHQRGVVHGQVAPERAMLDSNGRARWTDFAHRDVGALMALGAPYMAPEMLDSQMEPSPKADQYALAMVGLYTLNRGPLPMQARTNPLDFLEEVNAAPAIKRVLARGLANSPDGRWPDLGAMATALTTAITEGGGPRYQGPTGRIRAARRTRGLWALALWAGVGVVLGGGGVGLLMAQRVGASKQMAQIAQLELAAAQVQDESPSEALALLRAAASLKGEVRIAPDPLAELITSGAAVHILPHERPVTAIEGFADDKRLVAAADKGMLSVWDTRTGTQLGRVDTKIVHPDSLSLSNSGDRIAVQPHTALGRNASGGVVWALDSGEVLHGSNGDISRAELSQDGQQVVVLRRGEEPVLLEGYAVGESRPLWQREASPRTVFRSDVSGSQLAVVNASTLDILDWTSGDSLFGVQERQDPTLGIGKPEWSLDGQRVGWASRHGGTVADPRGETPMQTLRGVGHFLKFSPDGRRIAVAGGVVRKGHLYADLEDEPFASIEHRGWFPPIFSEDGKLLYTSGALGRLASVDSHTGVLRRLLHGHQRSLQGIRWINGKVATASLDESVRLWTPVEQLTGELMRADLGGRPAIFSGNEDGVSWGSHQGGELNVWSSDPDDWWPKMDRQVTAVSIDSTRRFLAVMRLGQSVTVVDLQRKSVFGSFGEASYGDSHQDCLAVSPNAQRLAVTVGLTVRVFDVATETELYRIPRGKAPFLCPMFTDAGKELWVTSGRPGRMERWRMSDGERLETVVFDAEENDGLAGVVPHPDGRLLAVVSYAGLVALADSSTGETWTLAIIHKPQGLKFSPSGKHLAVVGVEGNVEIFDVATRERIAIFVVGVDVLSMVWHPNEDYLIFGYRSGFIRVFSLEGVQLSSRNPHQNPVLQVLVDRSRLFSIDFKGAITVFDLNHLVQDQTPLRATGELTNLRVCPASLEVVPVVPFPDPASIWAPESLCGEEEDG